MKNLKRIFAVVLVLALALMVVGCEKKQDNSGEDGPNPDGRIVGGWEIYNQVIMDKMTPDELTAVTEALGDDAIYITPVYILATQVVAGTNYAVLGVGTINSQYDGWQIITYYSDLQGNNQLMSIVPLDITDLKTVAENAGEQLAGGWTVTMPAKSLLENQDVQAVFDKAMEGYVGVNLVPIQELAEQLVSGTNHMFICIGEPVTANPVPAIYVVTVYEDLDGNAEVSSVEILDIGAYINN